MMELFSKECSMAIYILRELVIRHWEADDGLGQRRINYLRNSFRLCKTPISTRFPECSCWMIQNLQIRRYPMVGSGRILEITMEPVLGRSTGEKTNMIWFCNLVLK